MTQAERASAAAAFFAGRDPAAPEPRRGRPTARAQLRAAAITVVVGLALTLCSLAFPLTVAAGGSWAAGSHLSLFCHLAL